MTHAAPAGASASSAPVELEPASHPLQPLLHLDVLWIQVAGTLCNLSCAHCFVSSGPGVDRHAMMSRGEVRRRLAEAEALGVKEVYFTGGEPFLNPEMLEILEDTLARAPATVLTNGTLFTTPRLARLARLAAAALEIRVSLDGDRAELHDALRGPGTFGRAMKGLRDLERAGLLPIVTVTQFSDEDPVGFRDRHLAWLRDAGLTRPRLKVIPRFVLGREVERAGSGEAIHSLRDLPPEAFDPTRLQCGSCRAVTSQGVFVCPLLVDQPGARLGERLADALGPFELSHGACHTCWVTGMTCGNG